MRKVFKGFLKDADTQGVNLPVEGWAELMGFTPDSILDMHPDDFQHYLDNAIFEMQALEAEAREEFGF